MTHTSLREDIESDLVMVVELLGARKSVREIGQPCSSMFPSSFLLLAIDTPHFQ
jgi:hypothetical protein